jgi:hypothetical protein
VKAPQGPLLGAEHALLRMLLGFPLEVDLRAKRHGTRIVVTMGKRRRLRVFEPISGAAVKLLTVNKLIEMDKSIIDHSDEEYGRITRYIYRLTAQGVVAAASLKEQRKLHPRKKNLISKVLYEQSDIARKRRS